MIAGVDGCRGGWVIALAPAGDISSPSIRILPKLEALFDGSDAPLVTAVDMPIGLPARIEGPGRAPERLVRPLLGKRQSSVFSIPARSAVYAADYRVACTEAAACSDPSRRISKQGFMIFPKIREIDDMLRRRPELTASVFESHPEVAFMALSEGKPLPEPKKVKGRLWPAGIALRKRLLAGAGISEEALDVLPPRGAAIDDMLDALACLVTAQAIAQGRAQSWPAPPQRDACNIPIAIWAPLTQSS